MRRTQEVKLLFLLTLASGVLLNPLNSSMISVALPHIQHFFGITYGKVVLLVSVYYVASAVAQPIMGKMCDRFGPKKLFRIGLVFIFFSAVAAPFAPFFVALIVFRLLQAIGSSAMFPVSASLIGRHIKQNRASAFAVIAVCTSSAAALGPTIGGMLVSLWDWPAIFTVNFPLIIISFVLSLFFLPNDKPLRTRTTTNILASLDLPGIVLFCAAIIPLLWFIMTFEAKHEWYLGIFGTVIAFLFIFIERKSATPFIDVRLFVANKNLSSVYILFILLNIFNYSLFFGMPSYLQEAFSFSAWKTGLFMLLFSASSVIASSFSGNFIKKRGELPLIIGSAGIMICGAFFIATTFQTDNETILSITFCMLGISYGIMNVALQSALLLFAPEQSIGTASGLFQTCRYLGAVLSASLLGIIFVGGISINHIGVLGWSLCVVGILCMSIGFGIFARKRLKKFR